MDASTPPTPDLSQGADTHEVVTRKITEATRTWANMTLADIRASFETLLGDPGDAAFDSFRIAEIEAAWIGQQSGPRTILFFHGGGYQVGSIRSHFGLMTRIAAAAGVRVLGFNYRRAPEQRFPTAHDDALRVHKWLLAYGLRSKEIAFCGDSAGAALALDTALRAQAQGFTGPACIALMSPWVDLTMRGDSYRTRADLDVFSKPAHLEAMARSYLGRGGLPNDPRVSPVEADLTGLAPLLIHGGDFDITIDDAKLLQTRAVSYGVDCQLRVFARMPHHFQVFPELQEAAQSVAEIGAFIAAHLDG